jgi:uncharacterized iron-regulated protein
MINPNEWLRTRKNLLDQVKTQVQIRLGTPSRALAAYSKNLDAEFSRSWKNCSLAELQRGLSKARVIVGADFHAYGQSQRAHVRILRDHLSRSPVILALECLPHDKEKAAAAFLKGKVSEAKFLAECEWEKNWGFPWEHYRPLFELARDRGFEVRGIGQPDVENLSKRDQWTSSKILKCLHANPEALVYAVIGEWHVASSHLPRKLKASLKKAGEVVALFQDVEKLYFQLAKSRKEGAVEFMKAPGDRYCMMVSPPWMKWQSYLMYLEQAYDRDLQEDLAVDYTDHVASLIELLEGDLKADVPKSSIQVYCPSSKTSLSKLKVSLPKNMAKALVYHLEHDLSFYLPEREWLYLSRATINHASSLAGQYVHAHLSHRRRTLWRMPKDFLPLIWVEALGFFFSKWINPKRKAETLESIRMQLSARNPKDAGRKALLLALDHRLSEVVWVQTGRLRRTRFKARELSAYLEASRIVGSMLGERLFQKVRSRTISLAQLMSYLRVDVESREFTAFYWELVRRIENDQVP